MKKGLFIALIMVVCFLAGVNIVQAASETKGISYSNVKNDPPESYGIIGTSVGSVAFNTRPYSGAGGARIVLRNLNNTSQILGSQIFPYYVSVADLKYNYSGVWMELQVDLSAYQAYQTITGTLYITRER